LLKNPRCYSKLQAEVEVESLLYDPNNPAISFATAQSLPYFNACINEFMRLHVVTRMPHDRVVLSTGLLVYGEYIAAGTDVGVYGSVLHHRADIFGEDVDVFRPERWLGDEEKVKKMKNTLFTFSGGKYNCLEKNIARMEIAKLIPSMMRAFEVSSWSLDLRIMGIWSIAH
jgi:cytochrome P450